MEKPIIRNIIATARLGRRFDLPTLKNQLGIVKFMPQKFPSLIVPILEPRCKISMVRTGRIVCLGCKTEEDCLWAIKTLVQKLSHLGYEVGITGFRIRNLVASFFCGNRINLSALSEDRVFEAMYNPEIFPGLTCKLDWPPITLLLFTSGKVIITGACTTDEIESGFQQIKPILEKYKCA